MKLIDLLRILILVSSFSLLFIIGLTVIPENGIRIYYFVMLSIYAICHMWYIVIKSVEEDDNNGSK